MTESIPQAYKPWIVLAIAVLVGSLVLVAVAVTAGLLGFGQAVTPLWVIIAGAAGLLGVAGGFAGFLGLMLVAGWHSFRKGRRGQVLPPER